MSGVVGDIKHLCNKFYKLFYKLSSKNVLQIGYLTKLWRV